MVAADLLPSLEGVELGSYGKVNVYHMLRNRNTPITETHLLDLSHFFPLQTVSYAQFLYQTNALVRQKSGSTAESCPAQTPQSRFRVNGQRNFTPARPNNSVAQEPCTAPF